MVIFILGFVLGVWLLQQQSELPSLYWLPIMVVGLGLFAASRYFKLPQYYRFSLLFMMAVFVGFFYATMFATSRLSDELPKAWELQNIEVIGVVATMPEVNARGERFRFDIEQVLTHGALVPRRIGLRYYHPGQWYQPTGTLDEAPLLQPAKFSVGERWRLTVKLKRPHSIYNPHGYDFEAWALAHHIRAMGSIRNKSRLEKLTNFVWRPNYLVEHCREKVGNRISQVLANKSYAGVVRGLVVGDDSQIAANEWDVYLRTGTNHLMSISGLHITMLAGLAFTVVAFIWRRNANLVGRLPTRQAATMGGALAALLYACLAGLSIPTQRTLYMLMVFAVALMLRRRVLMSRVLTIALLVVVLLDPWAVIAPGFWLSFSAVAVITYASVNRLKVRHWLLEAANTQWSVTLGLLPLLVLMFNQASILSPVANAFAIPVISLLVVPLAIAGSLLPFDFILHLSQSILAGCMVGLNWLASASFSTWQQAAAPAWTFCLAVIGVLWLLLPKGLPLRWLGLTLLLPLLLVKTPQLLQGEMQVTVLDAGQGLSVVVKTATHVMLYDTGQRYNHESDAGVRIIAPYLSGEGIKQLDMLVVSHDDNDHRGGADSILTQFPVKRFLTSFAVPKMESTTITQCHAGQAWQWDAVKFEVLWPTVDSYQNHQLNDNDRSCVIKVSSQYGTLLLTGDIEKHAEHALLQTHKHKLVSDVMLAPHHGSQTSSTGGFVQAVNARHVIFPVGYLNRHRHPNSTVESRFLAQGAVLYRTDYDGAVTMYFNQGSSLHVETERAKNRKYWHDEYLRISLAQ